MGRSTRLWSLGVVLFRALAGRTPNDGTDALGELILALCTRPPVPVQDTAPWVRSEIAAIVRDTLQISRAVRFQSVAAMLAAITTQPAMPPERTPSPSPSTPTTAASSALMHPRISRAPRQIP